MNRRQALSRVSLILGGTIVGANVFLQGCRSTEEKTDLSFSDDDIALLDEVAETIIPETDTPGAKAAGVGAFMALMVTDCYTAADQEIFHKGIQTLREQARAQYDREFMALSAEEKHAFLVRLDQEQKVHFANKKEGEPSHYFRMMKELTLLGYFTSEPGCTQAQRYVESPGRWEACVPYAPGEKAWSK